MTTNPTKKNQPLLKRLRNGRPNQTHFSTAQPECECILCNRRALGLFSPPLCQQHWDVYLLVSLAQQRGLSLSLEPLLQLKEQCPVRWQFTNAQLPALLHDIKTNLRALQ